MKSTVYFTKDISPEGLIKIYEAMNWTPKGKVAVKISTGEIFNPNSLDAKLIYPLVKKVKGKLVENNTAYEGVRIVTPTHFAIATKHGYTFHAGGVDFLDKYGAALVKRINNRGGLIQTDYGEEFGLGSKSYEVIDLD